MAAEDMSGKYISLDDLKKRLLAGGINLNLDVQDGTLSALTLRTIVVSGTPGDKADVSIDHTAAGGATMKIK